MREAPATPDRHERCCDTCGRTKAWNAFYHWPQPIERSRTCKVCVRRVARQRARDRRAPMAYRGARGTPVEVWVQCELAAAPQPVTALRDAAQAAGIAWRTLKRAKRALGIVSERWLDDTCVGGWQWRLPEPAAHAARAQVAAMTALAAALGRDVSTLDPAALCEVAGVVDALAVTGDVTSTMRDLAVALSRQPDGRWTGSG
jgi:hypothetical protein